MKDQDASTLSVRAVLWLSIAVVLLIARSVSDIISIASSSFDTLFVQTLRLSVSLGCIVSLCFVVWTYVQTHSYRNRLDFFSDFSRLLFFLFLSVLPFGSGGQPDSVFFALIDNMFFAVRVFTTIYTVVFVYRALSMQRTSQTQRYTRVILIGTAFAFVVSFVAEAGNEKDLKVIVLLLGVVLGVILYLAVKRRTWVLLLAAGEKRRLLLLVFLGILLSLTSVIMIASGDTELFFSLNASSFGFPIVMAYAGIFLCIFCERVFWTVLFSLPNSSMVERRNFEFSSVAYLNRIAAESTDLNKLYSTVTSLALQATRATSAWSFAKTPHNGIVVTASERITPQQIEALTDSDVLLSFASSLQQAQNVEYLTENGSFAFLSRSVESFTQSMIVAPLRCGRDFVGAIVVCHSQPFSFESDDVQALAAFASSASVALENARLVEDSLEKERYHRELMVGREIQKKLLPQSNPSIEGYDIFAVSNPAMEVGGDYYDYFSLADGKPCILIADVSGKGISAAFYMAKLKGVALALAHHSESAQQLVEQINATLFGTMERQMYITLTAIHFAANGNVSLLRAGHTPALVLNSQGARLIKPKGLGIGLAKPSFFSSCIRSEEFHLDKGASLVLFTDGINEARNNEGEDYGLERLEATLSSVIGQNVRTANSIAHGVMKDVDSFAGFSMQHDDMTLIVVQRIHDEFVGDIEPKYSDTITLEV